MDNLPDCQYEYKHSVPLAEIVESCMDCDSFICVGDEFYNIDGHIICMDCIKEYKKVGEIND
jgi:hypothetical protein